MAEDFARSHILIVIPKRDELRSAAAVFGFSAEEPHGALAGSYEAWTATIHGLVCTILLADGQGAAAIALATKAGLDVCDPSMSMCIGTAAGREGRTNYLDVVLAGAVLDASEWRAEPGGLEPQWDGTFAPSTDVRHDLEAFITDNGWHRECRDHALSALAELRTTVEKDPFTAWPKLHDGWVVTTGFLHQDRDFLHRIWNLHARLRIVDMETAGFARACENDPRRRPWCVVRSVSDFGTPESKRDELRAAAGVAAASVCRSLLSTGLRRAHPLRLHPKASGRAELSDANFFSSLSIRQFVSKKLRQFGISLDASVLTSDLSISDLAALCVSERDDTGATGDALDQVREAYFTQKYMHYGDEADVRGHVGPSWAEEVHRAYEFIGIDIGNADILYVGVSTGRDIPLVCPSFRSLRGVDLSTPMLERAVMVENRLAVSRDSAERLDTVEDRSVDLYLSLRTYQSSLFGIPPALRQAYRVIRGGGGIVLSIPGGYVDRGTEGEFRYVPGLLVPGSTVVDPERPRRLAERIIHQLEHLTFERIGFHRWETDLYIYARKRLESTTA